MISQIKNVAGSLRNGSPTYYLIFLSLIESWDLFEHKVFPNGSCPQDLNGNRKEHCSKMKRVASCNCGCIWIDFNERKNT